MDDQILQKLKFVLDIHERVLIANEDGTFTIKSPSGERTYTKGELLKLAYQNKWLDEPS